MEKNAQGAASDNRNYVHFNFLSRYESHANPQPHKHPKSSSETDENTTEIKCRTEHTLILYRM